MITVLVDHNIEGQAVLLSFGGRFFDGAEGVVPREPHRTVAGWCSRQHQTTEVVLNGSGRTYYCYP